jgi:hypothetical protein
MDNFFSKMEDGEISTVNVLIKSDVRGSAQALVEALEELSTDEVKVKGGFFRALEPLTIPIFLWPARLRQSFLDLTLEQMQLLEKLPILKALRLSITALFIT